MYTINIILSHILLISALITISLAIYTFQFRQNNSLKAFAFLCMGISFYTFGYAMELLNNTLDSILFWNLFEYIGLPFIPTFWLILSIYYCKKEYFLTPFLKAVLFIFPIITLILRYTSHYHHLYYADVILKTDNLFPIIWIDKGPWYFIHVLFSTIIFIFSNILYYQLFSKSEGQMKKQNTIIFFASLFPWITVFTNALGIIPYGIDIGPFSVTLSIIILVFGIIKFNLFIILPIAKEKVFESTKNAIIILDNSQNIIDFNPHAAKVFYELSADSKGKPIQDILGQYDDFIHSVNTYSEAQIKLSTKSSFYYYDTETTPFYNSRGKIIGYIVTLNDVTKYHEALNQLETIAAYDSLTEVLNRRYLFMYSENELERAKRYNHSICLALIDIDHFKILNDEYGHQVGDEALKSFVRMIKENLRTIDIIGRYGGEEFMIILPETSVIDGIKICTRLKDIVSNTIIHYKEIKTSITISIGLTGGYIEKDTKIDDLIRAADIALYSCKAHGRNCIQYISINEK